tara:strand:- start:1024 stop:1425 length:402 start_codon:yes stop_codon:yes gene_type:complete
VLAGSCLCGAVSFAVSGEVTDIYQCHCSICRKTLGASGGSVCLSSGENFRWVSGENQIQLFKTPSGYRSVFCRICGSHLPDPNPDLSTYWIPVGLLELQDPGLKVGAHVFVDSKATWDVIGDDGVQYSQGFTT